MNVKYSTTIPKVGTAFFEDAKSAIKFATPFIKNEYLVTINNLLLYLEKEKYGWLLKLRGQKTPITLYHLGETKRCLNDVLDKITNDINALQDDKVRTVIDKSNEILEYLINEETPNYSAANESFDLLMDDLHRINIPSVYWSLVCRRLFGYLFSIQEAIKEGSNDEVKENVRLFKEWVDSVMVVYDFKFN